MTWYGMVWYDMVWYGMAPRTTIFAGHRSPRMVNHPTLHSENTR